MNKLAFRDFIWPENPEQFTMAYLREPQYENDEHGNPVYLGLGPVKRSLSGKGVFPGPLAYENFQAMETLFLDPNSGNLTLPQGGSMQAYFTELELVQDPRPELITYSFTFREADDSGGIPE